jgi:hypothetical protein
MYRADHGEGAAEGRKLKRGSTDGVGNETSERNSGGLVMTSMG